MSTQIRTMVARRIPARRVASWTSFFVAAVISVSAAHAQTTVTLSASARVKADAVVKLADVATIVGDESAALGGMTVIDNSSTKCAGGSAWFELSAGDVRSVLEASGTNLGRTTLRGATCVVRITGTKEAQPAVSTKAKIEQGEPAVVNVSEPPTVRTVVALTLARFLGVGADSLKLGFDAKDESLLLKPTAGKRVDVQPAASSANEQMPVRIYTYSGDTLLSSQTITVKVQVRRSVLTAAQTIERKGMIEASMLTTGQAWVSPNATITCTMEQAMGAVARNRITAGQAIVAKLIETPQLVKRGDTVEIHCLSGAVTLKAARARAMGAGREGEYVAFQLIGSKKTFTARVSGRGRAIMVIGENPTEQADASNDRGE